MGGRLNLPTPITEQQLAYDAIEFTLYNRLTGEQVACQVVEENDRLILTTDTDEPEPVLYIDKWKGLTDKIVLYPENNSTDVYNLYSVTWNEDVHSVEGVTVKSGTIDRLLYLVIDGKTHVPYLPEADNKCVAVTESGTITFVPTEEAEYDPGVSTLYPYIRCTLHNGGTSLNIEGYGRIANRNQTKHLATEEDFINCWYDGVFYLENHMFIRINGVNHLLSADGNLPWQCNTVPTQMMPLDGDDQAVSSVYNSRFATVSAEDEWEENPDGTKEEAEARLTTAGVWGTWGNYLGCDNQGGDYPPPFSVIPEA